MEDWNRDATEEQKILFSKELESRKIKTEEAIISYDGEKKLKELSLLRKHII